MAENILQVKNLKTYFHTEAGLVKAVNDVSFNVEKGKTLGIVGESGCGKSITSLSIMGLVERPGKIEGGEILFEGEDLLKMTEAQMRDIRGKKIAMIFQEPMTSLNPVYTIGQQLIEALLLHEKMTKQEAKARAIEMLKLVKIPLAERRFDEYPHQLSGGMSQRVGLARALAAEPELLLLDEAFSSLDALTRRQLYDEFVRIHAARPVTTVLVTHDVTEAVLLSSRICRLENGVIARTYDNPAPYPRSLATPGLGALSEEILRGFLEEEPLL